MAVYSLPCAAQLALAARSPEITSQRLLLEIGRHSRNCTKSPILKAFASSCAAYFLDRRTYLPYIGSITRRSTRTTMVLSILSLTTTPSKTLLGILDLL